MYNHVGVYITIQMITRKTSVIERNIKPFILHMSTNCKISKVRKKGDSLQNIQPFISDRA